MACRYVYLHPYINIYEATCHLPSFFGVHCDSIEFVKEQCLLPLRTGRSSTLAMRAWWVSFKFVASQAFQIRYGHFRDVEGLVFEKEAVRRRCEESLRSWTVWRIMNVWMYYVSHALSDFCSQVCAPTTIMAGDQVYFQTLLYCRCLFDIYNTVHTAMRTVSYIYVIYIL